MRKSSRRAATVLAAAVGVGSLVPTFTAQAGTFTYSGGAGNWSVTGNWSPAGTPNSITDVDIFGTGGNNVVIDNTPRSAGTLIFNRNGVFSLNFLGNGSLTLGNGITAASPNSTPETYTITAPITLGANNIWNVDSTLGATTLIVSSAIIDGASTFGLNKIGSGVLVLGGGNTYDGLTTINAGTLLYASSTNNIIGDNSIVTVDGSTAVYNLNGNNDAIGGLTLDNGGQVLGGSATLNTGSFDLRSGTISTALRGSAGLNKTTGNLVTISSNGTYSGATTISGGGTLAVASLGNSNQSSGIGSVGTGNNVAGNLVLNNGFLRFVGASNSSSDRLWTLGAGGGGFDNTGGGGVLTLTGNMTASASTGSQTLTLTGTNTGGNVMGGAIVNGGGTNVTNLLKDGTGFWALTGANTYSGLTTINNGTLQLGAGTTTGSIGSGSVDVEGNLVFNRTNPHTFANLITGGGNLYKSGTGTTTLTNLTSSYTGATIVNAGTLEIYAIANAGTVSSIGAASNDPANLVLNGGTLRYLYQGTAGTQAALDAGQTNRRITLGANSGTIDSSGNGPVNFYDNGALGFTGSGARTLNLTGSFVDPTDGTDFYSAVRAIIGDGAGGLTSVAKYGTGEWVLTGANTYGGTTTINAGTLLLAHADSGGISTYVNVLPSTTAVTVNTGGELALYTGDSTHAYEPLSQTIGGLSGNGIISLSGGSLIVNLTASTNTFTGLVRDTVNDGIFTNQTTGSLAKSGAGTLILSGTNSYTGPTYITGGVLSVGTLANGGANSNIGASGSLAGNVVLGGGSLRYTGPTVTTDRLFSVAGGSTGTIDASSGSGSVLTLGNAGVMGFTGSGARTLSLAGTNTGNNTLAAIIGDGTGGATSLTKEGIGKWILSGSSTYTGTTTVNGGTLVTSSSNRLPSATALTINGNGALDITNTTQTVNSLNSASASANIFFGSNGSLIVNYSGGTPITYAGAFTSSSASVGGLVKSGTGTLSLTASNANVFATSITGGVLQVIDLDDGNGNSSLGDPGNALTLSGGGILRYDDNGAGDDDHFDHPFTLGVGGGGFDASGSSTGSMTVTNTMTVSGAGARTLILSGTNVDNNVISTVIGGGALTNVTKTGTGIWQPTSNNTYTGVTSINGGTLVVASLANGGSNSPIGASSNVAGNLILDGGTLRWTGGTNTTTDRLFSVGTASGAIDASGVGSLSFTNTGPMGFNSESGARTLTLRGSNTLNNAMSPIIGDNGGLTSLVKADAGKWILSGVNTYTGATTISAGTLAEGNSNVIGDSSSVVVNGSTAVWDLGASHTETVGGVSLQGGGNITGSGSSVVTLNTGSYDLQSGSVTIPLSGSAGLNKSGIGSVVLSGANTYTGPTSITAGTLQLSGSSNRLPTSTALSMSGGTFDMNGNAQTISSLAGSAGTVDLGGNLLTVGDGSNTTFSGLIIGAAGSGLIKQGAGSLTLVSNNTYVGTTTITNGVLEVKKLANNNADSGIGHPGTTNAGSLVINAGTLRYSGAGGDSTDRLFTIGTSGGSIDVSTGAASFTNVNPMVFSGTGARTLTLTGDNTGTMSPIIGNPASGSAGLTKSGAGMWVLTGLNTYAGPTTITGGTLSVATLGASNTNSGIGSWASNSPSNLVLNGGILRFAGSVTQTNSRNYTLGANGGGFDASGSVAAATLAVSGAMTAPTTGAQTLTLAGTNLGPNAYSGQIVDGGINNVTSLVKSGVGKWQLSHVNNTYSGVTTISAGTLALVNIGTTNNIASSSKIVLGGNLDVTGLSGSGITLNNNQTITGTGSVFGAVTANNSGDVIAPGNSPGQITFAGAGAVTLGTFTTVQMQIGGNPTINLGTGVAGTDYDQILMGTSGKALNLNGAKLQILPQVGIATGQAYAIVATTGTGAINFANVFKNLDGSDLLDNHSYTQGATQFTINYDSAFVKVTFSSVPEPGSLGLLMLAAPALLKRRRRR